MAVSSKGRVLVIDEACLVGDTLAQIFLTSGYEARAVYAADAALELLESDEWIPALAIIDVQLPGMNGIDLAIILKSEVPGHTFASVFWSRADHQPYGRGSAKGAPL
jgi:DNA-binding response OmpR family regulator